MLSWRNGDVHLQILEQTRARLKHARSSPIRKPRASAKRAKRLIKITIMGFSSRPKKVADVESDVDTDTLFSELMENYVSPPKTEKGYEQNFIDDVNYTEDDEDEIIQGVSRQLNFSDSSDDEVEMVAVQNTPGKNITRKSRVIMDSDDESDDDETDNEVNVTEIRNFIQNIAWIVNELPG